MGKFRNQQFWKIDVTLTCYVTTKSNIWEKNERLKQNAWWRGNIFFEKKILVEKFLLLRTMFTKKRGEFFETATVAKNDTA